MSNLVIVGKTLGSPGVVTFSPNGVDIGVHPLNGAGIPHFAAAAKLMELAGDAEFEHPQTQLPGQGFSEAGFRAQSTWQIILVTFDKDGAPIIDMSHGVRPTAMILWAGVVCCRTMAGLAWQQALAQIAMQNQQLAQALSGRGS